MKRIIAIALTVFFTTTLLAQVPNGTYVPITDMAKQLQFAKLEFSGNKVKIYMGMNGISLGVAQEYAYSMSGNTLSIKDGNTSVEYLSYDKAKDQIIYNMEASYQLLAQFGVLLGDKKISSEQVAAEFKKLGIEPPVWGKEGTKYASELVKDDKMQDKGDSWTYNPYKFYQELAEKCALYSKSVYKTADINEELLADGYTVKFSN